MESPILLPSNDMSVCTNCGAQMDLHRKYCPWCGTENAQAPESATSEETLDSSINDWDDSAGWAYNSATTADDSNSSATLKLPGRSVIPVKSPIKEPVPPSPSPSIGHTFRLWLRPLSLTLLIVLIAFIAFITLGIYQGINDRQVQNTVSAIDSFNEGRSKMDEGQYDLAVAHFREALRLEPNFEAAAQFLDIAEQNAAIVLRNTQSVQNTPEPEPEPEPEPTSVPDTSASEVEATPTAVKSSPTPIEIPVSVFDPEKLFDEAQTLLQNEEWELAAATLDALKSQAPDYQSEELAEGLASALVNLGNRALEEKEVKEALTYFEKAVTAAPDNDEVQELRTLTASYLNGQRAYDKQQWDTATKQLRKVYVLAPEFLDTAELLSQAHFELGQQFEERAIWCQAVEQYRSSLLVNQSQDVSTLADESERKCASEAIAAVASTQAINQLTSTATLVTRTPLSQTVSSPTVTLRATRGTPTRTPTSTPTSDALVTGIAITGTPTTGTPTTGTPTTGTPITNELVTSTPTNELFVPTVTEVPGSAETATIAAYYETATIAAYYETATIVSYYETATIAAYYATATQDTIDYYATSTAAAFDIYATVTAEAAFATATAIPVEPTLPISNPPSETPIPTLIPPTEIPIPTLIPPTETPVFIEPTLTIGPTPISEGLSSTPVPEPTVEGSSSGFTVASVNQNIDPSCLGRYIRGSVTLLDGAPVPGILIVAADRYGNTLQGTSKVDGLYDIPISDDPNTFTVTIIDGPSVTIEHSEDLVGKDNVCHIINWHFNP